MYRPRDVTATPAMAVTVRILYCISLWLPLAILSETKPAKKTMAIKAIHGQEAQKPMDFRDMLWTSVKYIGSHARKTYMM